jgi:hypothetical protein
VAEDADWAIYGDESSYNYGAVRGVGAVSLRLDDSARLDNELTVLLRESGVRELKWEKVRTARTTFAAEKTLAWALDHALGGALWVLVGVLAGLLAAVLGGRVMDYHRARSKDDVAKADLLAERGAVGSFELLYWRALGRIFLLGAAWAWAGTLIGLTLAILLLPRAAAYLTGRRIGFLFATLLGAALAAGYHAHVRGRRGGARWMALGAAVALVVLTVAERTAP